jgi:hypothetical protein
MQARQPMHRVLSWIIAFGLTVGVLIYRPLVSDMPRAKRAKDAKFGKEFLFFATFAFFARDIPSLGCGSASPRPSW